MRAIQLSDYGGSESLKLVELPKPTLSRGEVLVSVAATSLNPIDILRASGVQRDALPVTFPFIPGTDLSGVIVDASEGVADFSVGDAVWGTSFAGGCYAEFIAMDPSTIAAKPKNLTHVEAAALATVGLTGMQSVKRANVTSGQTILITGAGGAVGSVAVRYAANLGVRVIAQARQSDAQRLLSGGADRIVDSSVSLDEARFDVEAIIDTVGGEVQIAAFKKLRRGGSLIALNGPPSEGVAQKQHVRAEFMHTEANTTNLNSLRNLVEAGQLVPSPILEYSLSEVASTWLARSQGRLSGKVVFSV